MSVPEAKSACRYLGEKLLKVLHKDLSLLLDELLTAELEVSVHIFLWVNVVLLYLWRSLRATEKRGLALSNDISLRRVAIRLYKVYCVFNKNKAKKGKNNTTSNRNSSMALWLLSRKNLGTALGFRILKAASWHKAERLYLGWWRIRVPSSATNLLWSSPRRGW